MRTRTREKSVEEVVELSLLDFAILNVDGAQNRLIEPTTDFRPSFEVSPFRQCERESATALSTVKKSLQVFAGAVIASADVAEAQDIQNLCNDTGACPSGAPSSCTLPILDGGLGKNLGFYYADGLIKGECSAVVSGIEVSVIIPGSQASGHCAECKMTLASTSYTWPALPGEHCFTFIWNATFGYNSNNPGGQWTRQYCA